MCSRCEKVHILGSHTPLERQPLNARCHVFAATWQVHSFFKGQKRLVGSAVCEVRRLSFGRKKDVGPINLVRVFPRPAAPELKLATLHNGNQYIESERSSFYIEAIGKWPAVGY